MDKKNIIIVCVIAIVVGLILALVVSLNFNKPKSDKVDNSSVDEVEQKREETPEDDEHMHNKVAVVYFSATGTTKEVANYVKDVTMGDLIEIVPQDIYTSEDLDYKNDDCRASKEQKDSLSRPIISNDINVDDYDIIYLGYPIWFGDAPKIILTFLDLSNLRGKTIIPFCTSGSSDISKSVSYFKENYSEATWLDGKRLNKSKDEVFEWVIGLENNNYFL